MVTEYDMGHIQAGADVVCWFNRADDNSNSMPYHAVVCPVTTSHGMVCHGVACSAGPMSCHAIP